MNHAAHHKLVNFIWSIADDCLRDIYVRGKYRDVILPMTVLRRLDALLEGTKEAVLNEMRHQKEVEGLIELNDKNLQTASSYVFYNTSRWTLQNILNTATNSAQLLEANVIEYLNGFSPNVQEIIEKFKLKIQIIHMIKKDILLSVIEKFTSPFINLTNQETTDPNGNKLAPLTNLGMGYVFEELIRRFNEENNEEAGEHFTPREVIDLMTHLTFEPIKNCLPPIMTIYDPACGSGGMLTEAQNFITDEEGKIRANSKIYLYGKEINDETYAICKSDMLIKGNDPKDIRNGSTLTTDEFAGIPFDFMLSNPPYGKSWASEQKYIKEGKEVIDSRFIVPLVDYFGQSLQADATPRTSDGQLLFLMEMVGKMKSPLANKIGSRIASVHNGSSLFTGDAGSGESNIRRFIIENDLLDCIIQLPNNLFYNTGITTYIWFLSNNKPNARKGKVQLIDASELYTKLRKNLGNKNCELEPKHIEAIIDIYQKGIECDNNVEGKLLRSKFFNNQDFGYYKVIIERPKRLKAQLRSDLIETLRFDKALEEAMQYCLEHYQDACYQGLSEHKKQIESDLEQQNIELNAKQLKLLLSKELWLKHKLLFSTAMTLKAEIGDQIFDDFNQFKQKVDSVLKQKQLKLSNSEKNQILTAVSWYDENAQKVIKKTSKLKPEQIQALCEHFNCQESQLGDFGYFKTQNKDEYVEYESETDLKDSENIPLTKSIYDYFIEEVKPHRSDAWIHLDSVKIGYEISFNKYFYTPKQLRTLNEVSSEILKLEAESEGLLKAILGG